MIPVDKTDRNLNKLTQAFKAKVEGFLSEATQIFVTEAFRTQERQQFLYNKGRTTPWPKVTFTLNSNHSKWEAIDIAFNWDELYPEDIYDWREIAEIANKYEIDWGFDLWGTDKPHFQDNGKPLNKVPYTQYKWRTVEYNPVQRGRVNASYDWINHKIILYPLWFAHSEKKKEAILLHEFWHAVFIERFSNKMKKYWYDDISPNYWYVSEYAKKNPLEDFSECLEEYYKADFQLIWDEETNYKVSEAVTIFNHYMTSINKLPI